MPCASSGKPRKPLAAGVATRRYRARTAADAVTICAPQQLGQPGQVKHRAAQTQRGVRSSDERSAANMILSRCILQLPAVGADRPAPIAGVYKGRMIVAWVPASTGPIARGGAHLDVLDEQVVVLA